MRIIGKVVRGKGIGKKLGYPTANLEINGGLASPTAIGEARPPALQPGVYAARATYEDGTHEAAVVVGARYEGGKSLIEVHILDFDADLLGREITVKLMDKIAEIETFSDEKMLKKKIEEDLKKVRLCLRG